MLIYISLPIGRVALYQSEMSSLFFRLPAQDTKMDELMSGNSINPNQKIKTSSKKTMDQITNVYIWDMDETLILLKSLLNGTYAETFNGLKDIQKGAEIGKMWEKYILQVADDIFFYEQVSLMYVLNILPSKLHLFLLVNDTSLNEA